VRSKPQYFANQIANPGGNRTWHVHVIHFPPIASIAKADALSFRSTARTDDLDMSGTIWIYRPENHKGQWRGHQRVVAITEDRLRRLADDDLSLQEWTELEAHVTECPHCQAVMDEIAADADWHEELRRAVRVTRIPLFFSAKSGGACQ
jgi:hypothetical protein